MILQFTKRLSYLIEGENLRSRADHAILFLVDLVYEDVVFSHRVDDESLRVGTPGHVGGIVEVNVHAQRLVLLLIQASDVPEDHRPICDGEKSCGVFYGTSF